MDELAASYAYCADVARKASTNFHLSFVVLPRPQRTAMHAVYAFLRWTDDLADDETFTLDERRARLASWSQRLDEVFSLNERAGDPKPSDTASPDASADFAPLLWPALRDASNRYEIPLEYYRAVIRGAEMDLAGREYRSYEELLDYCYHVASAVGLICLRIWGCRAEAALEPARQCGFALQLTNILRDVGEDLDVGRLYLPTDDLAAVGLSREELRKGVCDERLRRLYRTMIGRARDCFEASRPLAASLDFAPRCSLAVMTTFYRRLLDQIEARVERGENPFSPRVRLGRWTKLRLAAGVVIGNLFGGRPPLAQSPVSVDPAKRSARCADGPVETPVR